MKAPNDKSDVSSQKNDKTAHQQDTIRTYALHIASRGAHSYKKLLQKLQTKFTLQEAQDAADFCRNSRLIDDESLSKNTALLQIQKKPHSKIQLQKRLFSYGFENKDINTACLFIETWYQEENELPGSIGGINLDFYLNKNNTFEKPPTIWAALTLSALIVMTHTNACDKTKAKNRLTLRGYTNQDINYVLQVVF